LYDIYDREFDFQDPTRQQRRVNTYRKSQKGELPHPTEPLAPLEEAKDSPPKDADLLTLQRHTSESPKFYVSI